MVWVLAGRTSVWIDRLWPPLAIVWCLILLGIAVERIGIVKGWYASPFVLGVVVATLRNGTGAGYIAVVVGLQRAF